MGCKKRFCNKHRLSHFPLTGKKCLGLKFCDLSLEGEIKDHTEQQGGSIGVLICIPVLPSRSVLKHDVSITSIHLDGCPNGSFTPVQPEPTALLSILTVIFCP